MDHIIFYFSIQPEKMSFRSYCSIIYCEPRMKIYIQVCSN